MPEHGAFLYGSGGAGVESAVLRRQHKAQVSAIEERVSDEVQARRHGRIRISGAVSASATTAG